MNRTLITAILLLPLLAWAQYDTPTLSSVVRVDAFVPVPKLSEDFLLNGDVACVVYLSETPNVIRTYPWSCFEKKHRIQDVITDERWEYEYDTTGKLQRMHSQYTMRGDYFIHDMSKPFKKNIRITIMVKRMCLSRAAASSLTRNISQTILMTPHC